MSEMSGQKARLHHLTTIATFVFPVVKKNMAKIRVKNMEYVNLDVPSNTHVFSSYCPHVWKLTCQRCGPDVASTWHNL